MQKLPWFRVYTEIIDDEKIRLLAFEDRWHYIALLACKRAGMLDAGDQPGMLLRKLSVKLGLAVREVEAALARLEEVGLVDAGTAQPTGWDERQFEKSDSSSERVRRHRARRAAAGLPQQVYIPLTTRAKVHARDGHRCVYCGSGDDLTIDHDIPESRGGTNEEGNLCTACRPCNASKRDLTGDEYRGKVGNGSVTLLKRPQNTYTDTDPEEKQKPVRPKVARPKVEKPAKVVELTADDIAFDATWKAYPKRGGGNSRQDARKAWNARRRDGETAEELHAGVVRYAAYIRGTGREHTEYVKQAATFLGPGLHFQLPWDLPVAAVNAQAAQPSKLMTALQSMHSKIEGMRNGHDELVSDRGDVGGHGPVAALAGPVPGR